MNKKYQIFISSTYKDLEEERRKVQDTILSMYQFPIGMEMFSAADDEQWEIIQETIDSSDYYVLIIGYRYGSIIETGEDVGISYTHKEFRYAVSQGIPVLAFLIDENNVAAVPDKMEHDLRKKDKLEAFKKEVMTGRTVVWWTSKDDLANKVLNSLNKEINRGKRSGWVRADVLNMNENCHSVSYLKTREEIDEKLSPLKNMFINVRALNIVTVSGINFLDMHSKKLINLLENKVKIQIVVLRPGTEAFKEHFLYKLNSLAHLRSSAETTWETWEKLYNEYETLNLKYTNICIPYSILYVEKENTNESFIKVDLYSIDAEPNDRPCLYIKPTDGMFDYFIEQFNSIWELAENCKI